MMKVMHMHREQSFPWDKPQMLLMSNFHRWSTSGCHWRAKLCSGEAEIHWVAQSLFSLLFVYQIGWQEACQDQQVIRCARFHLFYLCSILRLAKVVITYVNLIYMPSKVWRGLWAINVIQSEIKFLCHTVYIRLLLLLFLETKSTLDWPIALASRYTARLMHAGTRPVTVLVYHLSSPVLKSCCYLGLSQLNLTSLRDLEKVLEDRVAFRTVH